MGILDTVLQAAPRLPAPVAGYTGSFMFQAVTAVSVLLVAVGIFYVLIKLGSFLDAMKEKAEAGSTKK
jgi:succinate dehydrogenase hydrophobic anchor subunit